MDVAPIYRETRGHLLELARTMDDEQPGLPVPALPGWTVKDAYAHLTGLCADLLDGNMAGAGDPAWSRRQVAERAGSDLADVCAEWAERGPELDVWIEGREDPPMFVAYDVWSHEQDVMGALGLRGERDDERVQSLAASALAAFSDRFTAEGAPPLHVVGDEVECVLGEGEPDATLHVDDYELMRILFGRRSLRQIVSADWDGDVGPYVEHLHLFPLPERDLVD
ncbi:MAG TPA: maleylpyruvate isomerase family mycothiol-dependent enzyme [Acidimicrobiia bacterium]|jgi:uncharacterized protein (TIGR03083 family)